MLSLLCFYLSVPRITAIHLFPIQQTIRPDPVIIRFSFFGCFIRIAAALFVSCRFDLFIAAVFFCFPIDHITIHGFQTFPCELYSFAAHRFCLQRRNRRNRCFYTGLPAIIFLAVYRPICTDAVRICLLTVCQSKCDPSCRCLDCFNPFIAAAVQAVDCITGSTADLFPAQLQLFPGNRRRYLRLIRWYNNRTRCSYRTIIHSNDSFSSLFCNNFSAVVYGCHFRMIRFPIYHPRRRTFCRVGWCRCQGRLFTDLQGKFLPVKL